MKKFNARQGLKTFDYEAPGTVAVVNVVEVGIEIEIEIGIGIGI